ncbi:hypothetical protein BFP97_04625 [Roseivirga sp. 4D4]|uniref:2'-5' RNA ligase family protein n=1 Tax=Roseivirga sp. 4D4 TaxID=1889784 RepID=UPI000853C675|nr:hypothetical protein BFP97_04625 [Roseivirga sp. 4D4]
MLESNSLYYYLIVINPSDHVSKEVRWIKSEFAERYGRYKSLYSLPHITITNFFQSLDRNDRILECIADTVSTIPAFDVSLSGFDFFDSNNTLFIDIEDKTSLVSLYSSLWCELYLNWVPLSFFKSTYIPHLTIGRTLSSRQFIASQNEFYRRSYRNSFKAKSLTVLGKNSLMAKWDCIADFPFKQSHIN